MTIHKRIKEAREKRGLTQTAVAKELDVTPQAVQQWESDDPETQTAPRGKRLKALAALLATSPSWIQFGEGSLGLTDPNIVEVPLPRLVPVISWVQAGAWNEIIDNFAPGDAEDWLPIPRRAGPRTFAVKVRGESMRNPHGKPSYEDGDIIFVDPDVEATNKARVIVRMEDEKEATFKQLIIEGDRRYLKALNPNWPEPVIEIKTDATVCGVVVGKWVPE